jgi:hypothetical protein
MKNNPTIVQVQIEMINTEANKDRVTYVLSALGWLGIASYAATLLPPHLDVVGVVCSITISAAFLVATYYVYDDKIKKLSQIGGEEVTSEITLEQLKKEIQNTEK